MSRSQRHDPDEPQLQWLEDGVDAMLRLWWTSLTAFAKAVKELVCGRT